MNPDRSAPLVLGWVRALDRAAELRSAGLAYPAIAHVMAAYHGWSFTEQTWRKHLYERGVQKAPSRVRRGLLRHGRTV